MNAHSIVRPDVYQSLRVLGQRNFNVLLIRFCDCRQVLSLYNGHTNASSEVADAEARDEHQNSD